MTSNNTRENIVQAADRLFYRQGYEHTSFAAIADAVQISRGNFYYHFKTKDDILDAVIEARLANTRKMLDSWEKDAQTPKERVRCYINILIANRAKIKRHGCPVGTLTTELAKLSHNSKSCANKVFTLFRRWLCRQFELMGCKDKSDQYAMHVLAHSQGVATLANAFHDEKFIRYEVQQISNWLDTVASDAQHAFGSR